MARQESLLRASTGGTALQPGLARLGRRDRRDVPADFHTTASSPLSAGHAIDVLDDSPTLRLENLT